MSDAEKVLGCLMASTFIGVATVISALMNGWALTKLWGWFIVPVFNLPALTLAQSIGIAVTVSFLTHQTAPNDKDESGTDLMLRMTISAVLMPLVTVLIGYTVAQCL